MPSADIFETLYSDFEGLRNGPLSSDPSGMSALELTYPKVLLLASASYLEVATIEAVVTLFDGSGYPELRTFVERRSLKRQFHSLFEWDPPKANKFFSLFGDDCKARFVTRRSEDATFAATVDAFLEIGALRNQLVHNNYADFRLDKTAAEIRTLHTIAVAFPAEINTLVLAGP